MYLTFLLLNVVYAYLLKKCFVSITSVCEEDLRGENRLDRFYPYKKSRIPFCSMSKYKILHACNTYLICKVRKREEISFLFITVKEILKCVY